MEGKLPQPAGGGIPGIGKAIRETITTGRMKWPDTNNTISVLDEMTIDQVKSDAWWSGDGHHSQR